MKTTVVSYSLTGNNEALAASIAAQISAEHIKVTEAKKRSNGKVAMDMIFNRMPKVSPEPAILDDSDFIVFVGPVWMGQIASPLRTYAKEMAGKTTPFAYVSISGGALNDNPELKKDVLKRFGREADAVIDMHVADLIHPAGEESTMKETSSYRLTEEHKDQISKQAVEKLKAIIK